MPARSSAALMANAPRSTAAKPFREPSRRPLGVRAPATMTDPAMNQTSSNPGGTTFANIPTRGQCTSWRANTMLTRIDHVGIACHDLEEKIAFYETTFGLVVASREVNEAQGVREAMLHVADGPAGASYVQLLEPLSPDSPVGRFLAKRGEGLHHVGYAVPDVAAAVAELRAQGLEVIDPAPRI